MAGGPATGRWCSHEQRGRTGCRSIRTDIWTARGIAERVDWRCGSDHFEEVCRQATDSDTRTSTRTSRSCFPSTNADFCDAETRTKLPGVPGIADSCTTLSTPVECGKRFECVPRCCSPIVSTSMRRRGGRLCSLTFFISASRHWA